MTTEEIQRLNFYEKQFLRPRDFQDEQAYHIEMRRRHLIAHHTWGIVVGLEIRQDAAAKVWFVSPGMAVDGYGRELVVFAPEPLDKAQIDAQLAGMAQPSQLKVWLRYAVEKAQPPAGGYEVCGEADQFIRLREGSRLIYQDQPPGGPPRDSPPPQNAMPPDQPPGLPQWPVFLGTIIWDPLSKEITGASGRGRIYVGNITSEILTPAGLLDIRDRSAATPLPAGGAGVAVRVEGSLEADRLVRTHDDLRVDGKLAIRRGNDPIDTPLQVAGGNDASLQNGTGFVVVGKVDDKNLVLDNQTIQARNNQASAPLNLQPAGGDVLLHKGKPEAELVAMLDNGNLGLGVINPSEKLTVNSGSIVTNGENQGVIVDAAGLKRVGLMKYTGKEAMLIGHADLALPIRIGRWTGQDIHQPSSTAVDIVIDKTGNVGIGTTSPQQKCHVSGNRIRLQNGSKLLDLRADGSQVDLQSETNNLYIRSNGPSGRNNVVINALPALGDGNVGIGTEQPITKLHVRDSKPGFASLTDHVALVENSSATANANVLALRVSNLSPAQLTNFITFFGGNSALGAIEGNATGNGISFRTGSADFAECLPRLDEEEAIEPSDLVGVFAGRISKRTAGADHLAGISDGPIVLGNVPQREQEHLHHPVAFLGQVRLKVKGTVTAGDLIVPSGLNDGVGVSLRSASGTVGQLPLVVGRAWESSMDEGIKLVRVAVGIARDEAGLSALLAAMQREIRQLTDKVAALTAK